MLDLFSKGKERDGVGETHSNPVFVWLQWLHSYIGYMFFTDTLSVSALICSINKYIYYNNK